jgi:undecaprenyl-diphosphatase
MLQAIVLGLVQGATEYIPVSSKTHLMLVPYWLGWEPPSLAANIIIQLGTLVGVIIYFWRDLLGIVRGVFVGLATKKPLESQEARLGWYVVAATIPAVIFGLLLKKHVEELLKSPKLAMGFLLVTATWLVVAERFGKQSRSEGDTTLKDAMAMGFAQVFALFPGISRSGSTIGAGMLMGLTRSAAARFSFLMSIPVMLGASVIGVKDLLEDKAALAHDGPALLVGMLTAGVSGYLVIHWLLNFVRHRPLSWFAIYCAVLGGGGLIYETFLKASPSA